MSLSVSFVTTAYKTRDLLPELLDEIAAVASIFDSYQVVVVDDGCPHKSGKTAVGRPHATVVRLTANRGQRTATLMGMRLAKADLICVLDGDLQDDPQEVPRLVDEMRRRGSDVVVAGRAGAYESWRRRAGGVVFRTTRYVLSRGRIPRDAGLFHVARATAVRKMLAWASPGADPLVGYAKTGSQMVSVPVLRRPRPSGESAYTGLHRASLAAASIRQLLRDGEPERPWPGSFELVPEGSSGEH